MGRPIINIKIIEGADGALRLMKGKREISRMKPMLKEIGKFELARNLRNYRMGRDPSGRFWKGLTQNTLNHRDKTNTLILIRTGKLIGSFKLRLVKRGGKKWVVEIGPRRKKLMKLAAIHHFGMGYNPQRKILGVSAASAKTIERIAVSYITKRMQRNFGGNP